MRNGVVELGGNDAHHVRSVLRLRRGDRILAITPDLTVEQLTRFYRYGTGLDVQLRAAGMP